MADEPRWLTFEEVAETNVEQIDRFGGLPGIKDENLIRSAIEKPINSYHYGEDDLLLLAVKLGIAIAQTTASTMATSVLRREPDLFPRGEWL